MNIKCDGSPHGFWIAVAMLIIAFYRFDDMHAEGGSIARAVVHFLWSAPR